LEPKSLKNTKKVYQPPQLIVHGNLKELTRQTGKGGTHGDGPGLSTKL
jgi:hypothetical protein